MIVMMIVIVKIIMIVILEDYVWTNAVNVEATMIVLVVWIQ